MKKALIFLAEGFEEIEGITVIDILRRGDVEVKVCSISDELEVRGAHGIQVIADILLEDIQEEDFYHAVITPGGIPGATNLRDNPRVIEIIQKQFDKEGQYIGAICASPIVLKAAGISAQIRGTAFPGSYADVVEYREYVDHPVVMDKNVITSQGPATSIYFALKLLAVLTDEEKAQEIGKALLLPKVEAMQKNK